jgi:very-short-patch-repair endonuclease
MVRFTLAQLRKSNAQIISISPARNKTSRNTAEAIESPPQRILWESVSAIWPQAVQEFRPIDGRKFRVDIAFVENRVAIEVDGWAFHGKHRSSHAKDRQRQNLLVLNGWLVLRFTAGEIFGDMQSVLDLIESMLNSTAKLPTKSVDK